MSNKLSDTGGRTLSNQNELEPKTEDSYSIDDILAEFSSKRRLLEREEAAETEPPAEKKEGTESAAAPSTAPPSSSDKPSVSKDADPAPPDPRSAAPSQEPSQTSKMSQPLKPIKPLSEQTWKTDTIQFPLHLRQSTDAASAARTPKPPDAPARTQKKESLETDDSNDVDATKILHFPRRGPASEEDESNPDPSAKKSKADLEALSEDLETAARHPVRAGLDRLRKKADEFADHMYEEADLEHDADVRKAERLIPGVDEEEAPAPKREPRRTLPPAPDIPPGELAARYAKGQSSFKVRSFLVLGIFVILTYLNLAETFPLLVPTPLAGDATLRCTIQAWLQIAALILGYDAFLRGLIRPLQFRMGMDTLVSLSNLAVLADALTLPALAGGEITRTPLCMTAVLGLFCVMLGTSFKNLGQQLACRTAASLTQPYLVTRDEQVWNNRDTYAKWQGFSEGFGSQVQGEDGAEYIYRFVSPLLLLACVLFSVMASLGRERPENILWCLSASLTAAASLSATLSFGLPWKWLNARLYKAGTALAGWEGVSHTTGVSNILLTDSDFFSNTGITLNGTKLYGDFPSEKVIAYTATVIRDMGGGLVRVFDGLRRRCALSYCWGENFKVYEGGVSEDIQGEQVLVGSSAFMELMDVELPPGLNVKLAVYCAIDGELAGIFALRYQMSDTVLPALDMLARNHIMPVLATRDFNIIPAMLQQKFHLPVDRIEFPPVERRHELSNEDREHADVLTAILCLDGISPYAETMVGGKRLKRAVQLSTGLACLGAVMGVLLAFYLTFIAAYGSLTPINLTLFVFAWLVPTFFISGWVNRY